MLSMILDSGGVEMNAAIRFDGQADGWSRRRAKKAARLARVAPWTKGRVLETAAIVEATAFLDGVVVVQVNDIVDELPRGDIPASWVDVIVAADRLYQMDAEGNFSTVTCGGSAA